MKNHHLSVNDIHWCTVCASMKKGTLNLCSNSNACKRASCSLTHCCLLCSSHAVETPNYWPFYFQTRKIASLNTRLVFPFILVYHVYMSIVWLYSRSHKFLKHEIGEKGHIFKQLCHTVWNLEHCSGYTATCAVALAVPAASCLDSKYRVGDYI